MEITMAMLARPNMIHHMDVPNIMRDMAVRVDRSPGLASCGKEIYIENMAQSVK